MNIIIIWRVDIYCYLGSSHSDKELDGTTPEKLPRTPSERKRKRKTDDGGPGGKGPRPTPDNKKINEYFPKHASNSPIRHGGSKSPSPQQGYTTPMVSKESWLAPSYVVNLFKASLINCQAPMLKGGIHYIFQSLKRYIWKKST